MNYHSEDIANVLINLTREKNKSLYEEVENALYYLKTIASNEYNQDCYRVLWKVLQEVADNNQSLIYE